MKKYIALVTVLSWLSCQQEKESIPTKKEYQIGQKSITYTDTSRNRPLVTEIWYPTYDTLVKKDISSQKLPFKTIGTIPNAKIVDKKLPLLLFSHGTGGNRFSQTWLVEKMVKKGYIVVALDHFGNSSFNKIPREFLKWWERAIDIKFLIDSVLNDKTIGQKIDPKKIGGVGFSLGGYTQIALAGGYVDRDMSKVPDEAKKLPEEFPKTDEVIDFQNDSLIVESFKTYNKQVKDKRIKAFFVMAPGIGFGFHTKEQTKEITAPVFIVASKGDKVVPAEYNAVHFNKLIPSSKIYLFDENVSHYVFLNEGTEFGKEILPKITIDHPKVNRKEIHQKTAELAIDFFAENLQK